MKNPDDYHGIAPFYVRVLDPFLEQIRKDISCFLLDLDVRTAVDLGCGTGRQCMVLDEHGILAAGVDRSPAMLEKARNRNRGSIEYLLEDLTRTSFNNGSFDASVISLALHENDLYTQNRIIMEACRITRPGGYLAFLDHGAIQSPAARVIHYLACIPERLAGKKHFKNYLLFMKNKGLQGLLANRPGMRTVREKGYLSGAVWLSIQKNRDT